MKNKYAFVIIIVSILGLMFSFINTVFFVDEANPFLRGIELFKYFTIQSNLIVALYFSLFLLSKYKDSETFTKMIGGVVIYITITFLVFASLLEPTYSPKGFALIGSIFNHYLTPLLVIGFMYLFRKDYKFQREDLLLWIIYPILYTIFLVIIGQVTNDYIYPFFQVNNIGVIGLILSMIGMIILYLIMSFTLVKIVSKK